MPVRKYRFNSREEWLQARKNHIGGSDASACVGMNPYKDNVQLWEEKKGLIIPEDISERDYVPVSYTHLSVIGLDEPGDWYFLDNTVDGPLEGACWHERAGGFGGLEVWEIN